MDVRKVTGPQEALPRLSEEVVARGLPEVEREGKEPEERFPVQGREELFAKLPQLVERMNTVMEALAIEARFSIHEATHTIIVTLVNRETGEVVRQIPPEKLLDIVARFRELAGLFVDEVV